MHVIETISIAPNLPRRIRRLEELAYNLYWTWTPKLQGLFRQISPEAWERSNHNPVRTLWRVPQRRLEELAQDPSFVTHYEAALEDFDAYMTARDTWYRRQGSPCGRVAYFSMEFGFTESLPIYSGGLGILAGDHCKSASDLGLPFIGIGLLFRQGYFQQLLNRDGWQEELYEDLDFSQLPVRPAKLADGREVKVSLQLPGREVHLKVWTLQVGRVSLLLLDSNLDENQGEDRDLTARLYAVGQEMRIQQEMILGIAGVRALRALGEEPEVFHLNEGHAAFLGLERIREYVAGGLSFAEALEVVASSSIFTVHTPVAAGNDAFTQDLVDRYFSEWYTALQIDRESFMGLALHPQSWGPTFSMPVLALRLSRAANGVSQLHGAVSRQMWSFLYPGADIHEIPIGHVTNGIHTLSFLSPRLRELWDRHLGEDWTERIEDPATWAGISEIGDRDLAAALRTDKEEMIRFIRRRLREQYLRHQAPASRVHQADHTLRPDVLTIGFARRFATYKRATLLFRDPERLRRIINHPERPVQFVFAGKAHPADNPGKEFIQTLYRAAQDPELLGKVVILENYDIAVARYLVQGVDVWLNNPRRPLEASGTSGMKAALNGALNCSILDGWWAEGYNPQIGYAIGDEREYSQFEAQDDADSFSLYETLENEIVPTFYRKAATGEAAEWLSHARAAIQVVGPHFSMQRQVIEYHDRYYSPLTARLRTMRERDCVRARALAAWKADLVRSWPEIQLEIQKPESNQLRVGEMLEFEARLQAPGLDPRTLRVEVVFRRAGQPLHTLSLPLVETGEGGVARYHKSLKLTEHGRFELLARVLPDHPDLASPFEVGLVYWA